MLLCQTWLCFSCPPIHSQGYLAIVLIRVISICLRVWVHNFLHDMMGQDLSLLNIEVPASGIATEGVAMREFIWGTIKAAPFALQQRYTH